jgi:exonuclease SbcC
MILKKIDLHNYRQHRDLTVDFTGNLIAIVGRNGSGKSNFLGAIQFALTGEQPGFNKEDLLTWGEESGYVQLEFEHAGHSYLIQRRIEKPAATLTVDGKEKITGTKKVQETMDGILGVDKDVIRQSVFVRQTQIDTCLFDDSRTREQGFQKLLGLGDAAKYNKFLTDFLAAADKPIDHTQQILDYTENIREKEKAVEEAEKRVEEKKKKLEAVKSPTEANDEINDLHGKLKLLSDAKVAFSAFNAAYKNNDIVFDANKELLLKSRTDENEIQEKLGELNVELARIEAIHRRNDEIVNAKKMYDRAKDTIDRIGDLEERLAEYKEKADKAVEISVHRKQIERLSAEAPSGNVCPLCGSITDHNIKEQLERAINKDRELEEDLTAWCAEHNKVMSDLVERDNAERDLKRWEETLQSLGPWTGCRSVEEIKGEIQELRTKLRTVQEENRRIDRAHAEADAARRAMESAAAVKDAALSKLPMPVESEDVLSIAEDNINARIKTLIDHVNTYSAMCADVAMEEGALNSIKSVLAEMYPTLEKLKSVQGRNEILTKKLKIVEDVKNWFTYKNGPRTMTQSVMSILTDEVNRYLGQFGSPFTVVPMSSEEGMGFRVVFTDGRTVSNPPPEASMLSGGQKIQLAVAFRFSVYEMFASKLGLLSLDEPTAYLDDETIVRFGDMLTKIKEMAKNLNIQILMATHESSLSGLFDQTIAIS